MNPQPQRVRLADDRGLITREWLRWFETLAESIPDAVDVAGLQSQIDALDAEVSALPSRTASFGTAEVNFGTFPGTSDAKTFVSLPSVTLNTVLSAWISPAQTDDHSADEHVVETIKVSVGEVVPGVGFFLHATNTNQISEPIESHGVSRFRSAATTVYGFANPFKGGLGTRIYGRWRVAYSYI